MAIDKDARRGVEQRRDRRVKVHREISLRWSTHFVVGHTDNISERGVMITLSQAPSLSRGDAVEVEFTLPGMANPCKSPATVRWISSVLPGVLGLEFARPLEHDAREFLALFDAPSNDAGSPD